MKIETRTPAGQVVDGAKCLVTNDKNDAVMRSGQSLPVRRSSANLNIECTQPGYAPASGQAVSRVNTGMVGNILLGGVIGAAVDSGTGAGFNYPSWMQLVFGEVRNFDRSAQTGDQVTMGVRVGETKLASVAGKPATGAAPPQVSSPVPVPGPSAAAPTPPTVPPPKAQPDARVSMDDLAGLLPPKP